MKESRKKSVKKPDEAWLAEYRDSIKKRILRGDYEGGLKIARDGLKLYPKEFECRYQYAKLLGDWADELPPAKQAKFKAEAVKILRPLTRALSGHDPDTRIGLCLNYYYQSRRFADMYRYGKRVAAQGYKRGYYAQGLGACLEAFELYQKKDLSRAKRWAAQSVAAWKRFSIEKEKYYFAHYTYARALSLVGDRDGAMKRLRIAARLSKRKITDWEFADVLQILSEERKSVGI